jgi:hypothetical protein
LSRNKLLFFYRFTPLPLKNLSFLNIFIIFWQPTRNFFFTGQTKMGLSPSIVLVLRNLQLSRKFLDPLFLGQVSYSVADTDPGCGIRFLFDSWIRDPGWVKNQDPSSGSGSEMNNPDHIFKSLDQYFKSKYLNSLMRIRDGKNSDPGWKFGSGINIPDPQH